MKKYLLTIICLGVISSVTCWAKNEPAAQPSAKPVAATSQTAPKKDPQPAKNAQQSVTFNGKKFYLQYSNGNREGWINEYLPAGQNFNNYTEMVAFYAYNIKATPIDIAVLISQNYDKNFPQLPCVVGPIEPATKDSAKEKDFGVTFLIPTTKFYESNAFRITSQNGQTVYLQYVKRFTPPAGNAAEAVKAGLQKVEKEWPVQIQELYKMPLPAMVRTVKK